ncbi:MAG: ribosome silencing factor, partial [Pseudodesulfovibrio sp.]|nr:ribosome silencing factor [Pseudodesulfovibrio sp.]
MNKEKKFKGIPSEEKALLVAEWLYEKQGENIVIM